MVHSSYFFRAFARTMPKQYAYGGVTRELALITMCLLDEKDFIQRQNLFRSFLFSHNHHHGNAKHAIWKRTTETITIWTFSRRFPCNLQYIQNDTSHSGAGWGYDTGLKGDNNRGADMWDATRNLSAGGQRHVAQGLRRLECCPFIK